jgi:hypothetical protein
VQIDMNVTKQEYPRGDLRFPLVQELSLVAQVPSDVGEAQLRLEGGPELELGRRYRVTIEELPALKAKSA